MPKYGIEITDETGKSMDITSKYLMILDKVKLPYGINGSRTFKVRISNAVAIMLDEFKFNPNGLRPKLIVHDNVFSWEWVPCKGVMAENVTVAVWVEV